ncbi:unnamed protein product [Protopolystoma xenopodis]|uniref:Uncharacterized protein n=1 Tax=Protopolystoma xenopodis TaxID=117903 RepID=A0A3S5CK04_9PLAT|nr:unnamed protein product [Protopolystoma xenopodis]
MAVQEMGDKRELNKDNNLVNRPILEVQRPCCCLSSYVTKNVFPLDNHHTRAHLHCRRRASANHLNDIAEPRLPNVLEHPNIKLSSCLVTKSTTSCDEHRAQPPVCAMHLGPTVSQLEDVSLLHPRLPDTLACGGGVARFENRWTALQSAT